MCRVPLCSSSSWLTVPWTQGDLICPGAHMVPVTESVKSIWVSVGVVGDLLMTNIHQELQLLLNVDVHMLSLAGEHLLVQKCFMFSSSVVCVECSAPVEDRRVSECCLAKSTMENLFYTLFKLWISHRYHRPYWHDIDQAKHYDHMSKHCVLYSSVRSLEVFTNNTFRAWFTKHLHTCKNNSVCVLKWSKKQVQLGFASLKKGKRHTFSTWNINECAKR